MNLLMIKFKLWWYDVCPEHGPKQHSACEGGGDTYCTECDKIAPARRAARIKELQRLYRAAKFKGPEDAREDHCNSHSGY